MSQALRKLTSNLNKADTSRCHQPAARKDRGHVRVAETTPVARALKFYSSVRLDIRRIESIKDGVEVVGNRTRVKVVKNKCAPPFKQAEFDIMYGKGISREGSCSTSASISAREEVGRWYTYDGEHSARGVERQAVPARPPRGLVEISERIRSQLGIGTSAADDGATHDVGRRRRAHHARRLTRFGAGGGGVAASFTRRHPLSHSSPQGCALRH